MTSFLPVPFVRLLFHHWPLLISPVVSLMFPWCLADSSAQWSVLLWAALKPSTIAPFSLINYKLIFNLVLWILTHSIYFGFHRNIAAISFIFPCYPMKRIKSCAHPYSFLSLTLTAQSLPLKTCRAILACYRNFLWFLRLWPSFQLKMVHLKVFICWRVCVLCLLLLWTWDSCFLLCSLLSPLVCSSWLWTGWISSLWSQFLLQAESGPRKWLILRSSRWFTYFLKATDVIVSPARTSYSSNSIRWLVPVADCILI